jgi:hypothetical protein
LIKEIDRIVGPRRRSQFVTAAITRELKREKLLKAMREVSALPPVHDVPEWETPEGTLRWVREIREESDRHRNT